MPIIYARKSLFDSDKKLAAQKHFDITYDLSYLSSCVKNTLVIPRYSLCPFVKDQIDEISLHGCKPIDNYNSYLYVADLINYVADLKDLTPKTYDRLEHLPDNGPFILKGETNSRKNFWKTMMFAQTKKDAIQVHSRLCADSLISEQKIYIREYVPLVTYFEGIGGIPITKEFRFFIYKNKVVASGFYWQNYADDLDQVPSPEEVPESFLNKVISIVSPNVNFFVVDIAQTQSGEWIVIELNSGCQSGISCIDPEVLYRNLAQIIKES